jgi:hypothetical protein
LNLGSRKSLAVRHARRAHRVSNSLPEQREANPQLKAQHRSRRSVSHAAVATRVKRKVKIKVRLAEAETSHAKSVAANGSVVANVSRNKRLNVLKAETRKSSWMTILTTLGTGSITSALIRARIVVTATVTVRAGQARGKHPEPTLKAQRLQALRLRHVRPVQDKGLRATAACLQRIAVDRKTNVAINRQDSALVRRTARTSRVSLANRVQPRQKSVRLTSHSHAFCTSLPAQIVH